MKIPEFKLLYLAVVILTGTRGYRRVRNELWRLSKSIINPIKFPVLCYLESYAQAGKSFEIINTWSCNSIFNDCIKIQKIRILYFSGKYQSCISLIDKCNELNRELKYLKSDCLLKLGQKNKAIKILTSSDLLKNEKTWLKLANLVDGEKEFSAYKMLFNAHKPDKIEHYVLAAKRAGQYSEAIEVLKKITLNNTQNKIGTYKIKGKINQTLAEKALKDILNLLKSKNIKCFAISGTLLGLVRDKKIIPYDNDIDIGVMGIENYERVYSFVEDCEFFSVLPKRTNKTLRVRHINGTPIDIFFHWSENGMIWHGGVKVDWWNTPFNFTKIKIKDFNVLIPMNFDLYLRENYGNWKVVVEDFDSAIDTPNHKLFNRFELMIHCLEQINRLSGENKSFKRYIELLNKLEQSENE